MVVDGIDFRIQEHQKNGFNPKWYSHEYRKPGVRYEVAACFNTGHIVLIYGPFPCGSRDDIHYRLGLKRLFMRGEKVWTDGGYRGDPTILHRFLPGLTREFNGEMARGRTRYETINSRFSDWSALIDVYRHDLNKHYLVFGADAILTQIEILNGFTPFQCFSQHDSAFL
jgi:hypothetical protein